MVVHRWTRLPSVSPHTSAPYPHVVVNLDEWDDMTFLDNCVVPGFRDGSTRTLRLIADETLLRSTLDPRYTRFYTSGYTITSLHVERADEYNLPIDIIGLFHVLADMPSLVELTIWVNHLAHLAPVTETATIPFHLARLNIHPVFRGWPRLIAQSAGTLLELVLNGARATALELGAFLTTDESKAYSASLRSVKHLCLFNAFDPAIVRACPSLHTLNLNCFEHPTRRSDLNGVITCLNDAPYTLRNLVIGLHPSHPDYTLVEVADLLTLRPPVVEGLRSVIVQPSREWLPRFQDVLDDEGREARDVLQNFCREHRISLSLH